MERINEIAKTPSVRVRLCAKCGEVTPSLKAGYCRVHRAAYVRDQRKKSYGDQERTLAKARYALEPSAQTRHLRNRIVRDPVRYYATKMLADARYRSKKQGVVCDLDVDWLMGKIKGGCEVTGLPFDLTPKDSSKRKGHRPYGPSLDRKEPGGDYTKDNIQVTVFVYNFAKSNWGHEVVMTMAIALVSEKAISL